MNDDTIKTFVTEEKWVAASSKSCNEKEDKKN